MRNTLSSLFICAIILLGACSNDTSPEEEDIVSVDSLEMDSTNMLAVVPEDVPDVEENLNEEEKVTMEAKEKKKEEQLLKSKFLNLGCCKSGVEQKVFEKACCCEEVYKEFEKMKSGLSTSDLEFILTQDVIYTFCINNHPPVVEEEDDVF